MRPSPHPVSEKLSALLRHGYACREAKGAIEFRRSQHWSDEM